MCERSLPQARQRGMKVHEGQQKSKPGFEMEKLITLVIFFLRVFSNQGKVQRKEKVTEAEPSRSVRFAIIIFISSLFRSVLVPFLTVQLPSSSFFRLLAALAFPWSLFSFHSILTSLSLCIVYACFWTLGLDALGISWPLFGRSGFLELNS